MAARNVRHVVTLKAPQDISYPMAQRLIDHGLGAFACHFPPWPTPRAACSTEHPVMGECLVFSGLAWGLATLEEVSGCDRMGNNTAFFGVFVENQTRYDPEPLQQWRRIIAGNDKNYFFIGHGLYIAS